MGKLEGHRGFGPEARLRKRGRHAVGAAGAWDSRSERRGVARARRPALPGDMEIHRRMERGVFRRQALVLKINLMLKNKTLKRRFFYSRRGI